MKNRKLFFLTLNGIGSILLSISTSIAIESPKGLSTENAESLFRIAKLNNRDLNESEKGVLFNDSRNYVELMTKVALATEIQSVAECDLGWITELRTKLQQISNTSIAGDVKSATKLREKIVSIIGEKAMTEFEKTVGPAPKTNSQILIIAAKKNRNSIWTEEIPDSASLSKLVSAYLLRLYDFSATNKFNTSEECDWFSKMRQLAASDSQFEREFAGVVQLRNRLVDFAGIDAVSTIDLKSKPPSFPKE